MDFQPSQVMFGDVPGYGAFDLGHGREHIRFVQTLAARSPPILIPDADLLSLLTGGTTSRESFDTHQTIHGLLRDVAGIGGVDYSDFRLDDQTEFYAFLSYHEAEHAQLRAAFGLTQEADVFGDFFQAFGIPNFPFAGMDPQGGLLGANAGPEQGLHMAGMGAPSGAPQAGAGGLGAPPGTQGAEMARGAPTGSAVAAGPSVPSGPSSPMAPGGASPMAPGQQRPPEEMQNPASLARFMPRGFEDLMR